MPSEKKFSPGNELLQPNAEAGTGRSLSETQISAIRFAAQIGKQIQKDIPQIATDYEAAPSINHLEEKYAITTRYGFKSRNTAKAALLNALKGVSGKEAYGIESYAGLIPSENFKIIAQTHIRETSSKTGKEKKQRGTGIFSLTKEELRELGRERGTILHQKGLGIHAQTPEQRRDFSKLALEAQGVTTFSQEEENLILSLVELPQYRRGKNINWKAIAELLNSKFHSGKNIRKGRSVKDFLQRKKRQNRKAG